MTAISRLTDDCIELILSDCGSCPIILCILSQVCKRWRIILHRPTMVRHAKIFIRLAFSFTYTLLSTMVLICRRTHISLHTFFLFFVTRVVLFHLTNGYLIFFFGFDHSVIFFIIVILITNIYSGDN